MAWYTNKTADTNKKAADYRLGRITNEENRDAFDAYITKRRASALVKSGTHVSDSDEFVRFGMWLGKRSIRSVTPKDIVKFFGTQADKAHATRYKTYVILQRFFRDLHGMRVTETPPEFQDFKMKRPPKTTVRIEELITPDEFQRMLRVCRNSMERAILALLYECGFRAGELLSLDLKHVQEDQYGYLLNVPDADGNKTGGRQVRFHVGKAYLKEWLVDHQFGSNQDAPLLYGKENRARYKRYGYAALLAMVKRVRKDAKVTKDVWPHLYRHTAATENVKRGLAGPALCAQMGWVTGTEQEAVYIHLNSRNTDDLVLQSWGLKTTKTAENSGLAPRVCPVCKHTNLPDKLFCVRPDCFAPLTEDAERTMLQRQERMMQEMYAKKMKERGAAAPVLE